MKLREDNIEMSKHVGVDIIQRENIVLYICALVGCIKNSWLKHVAAKMSHRQLIRMSEYTRKNYYTIRLLNLNESTFSQFTILY